MWTTFVWPCAPRGRCSLLEFADNDERLAGLRRLRCSVGGYPTTEANLLRDYACGDEYLSEEEEGLRLVREACDELEEQASLLNDRLATTEAAGADTGD